MNFVVQLVIAIVMMVAAYLLAPRPKMESGANADELENPKASAGSPVKVVFGTVTIKDPNILWYGDKSTHTFKEKA